MEAQTSRRRSAGEWRRLIAEWQRSGQALTAFADARGIRPKTMAWWKWRLEREKQDPAEPAAVTLMEAVIVDDDEAAVEDLNWELRTRAGHTVKVSGSSALDALLVTIEALGLSDGAT